MLSDFFRINLPYGIAKNKNGEWMAFNREYMPIGFSNELSKGTPGESYLDLPVYAKYKKVSEKLLHELAISDDSIRRSEDGKIIKVFLYNDATNPQNQSKDRPKLWEAYFDKLKKLSKLNVDK
jgi:hypothetical protein